tara:strand:- start:463 stop:735 length:273 start_codon:yes stop_codon:yes gene_type:complete
MVLLKRGLVIDPGSIFGSIFGAWLLMIIRIYSSVIRVDAVGPMADIVIISTSETLLFLGFLYFVSDVLFYLISHLLGVDLICQTLFQIFI